MADSKRARMTPPSDAEDAAITAAAEADPDAQPLTDEQLAGMRPMAEVYPQLARRRGPPRAPTKVAGLD